MGGAVTFRSFRAGLVCNAGCEDPVDIKMKFKPGWTKEQKRQARKKVKLLSKADTKVVHKPKRSESAQSKFRKDNSLEDGVDADHTVDLQLGGKGAAANIHRLIAA